MYTKDKNIQILISILKKNRIKKIIVSPGTNNINFVGSIQRDDYFEIYSSADERSAAYMACGMSVESGEPVVISCTGATASRNYIPALTEAFYRKIPIIAITSHSGWDYIGNLIPQQIDRRISPSDIFVKKITLNPIRTKRDEFNTVLNINRAILTMRYKGGGPIHIDLISNYSTDYSVEQLPDVKVLSRYTAFGEMPKLPVGRIAIFIGSHRPFTHNVEELIDSFCESHNAVVFCDHTSNYKGRYSINASLLLCQKLSLTEIRNIDILIHLGEISGDYYSMKLSPRKVWRVNEDGEIKDLFSSLDSVFEMPEEYFFKYYADDKKEREKNQYLKTCINEVNRIGSIVPQLPFSNIWVAQQMSNKLPKNSVLHLGILNTLRAWNFFKIDSSVYAYSNVGGFGIDGGVSTLLGSSLVTPQKIYFGVFGDLAFFYDMNSLGNRYLPNNLRILLINNGGGTEFRNYSHPAHDIFGVNAEPYMAAVGHYGNKSKHLVKHYAEDLGFKYITAETKKDFLLTLPEFISPAIERPILFEVFTDSKDESDALEIMLNLEKSKDENDDIWNTLRRAKWSAVSKYNNLIENLKYK